MGSSSQLESIFSAALEKKTAAERAAYLDRACGADAALRLRVERLLEAHPQAQDFLAEPAVDRDQFNLHDADRDLTSLASRSGTEEGRRDPRAGSGMAEPGDEPDDAVGRALSFLQPSEKPGSLGRLAQI